MKEHWPQMNADNMKCLSAFTCVHLWLMCLVAIVALS
jgi:hypothetical protein